MKQNVIIEWYIESSVTLWHKDVTIQVMVVGLIPRRGYELLFINIFIIFTLVTRQRGSLSSATQHTMSLKFGGKWGTERLNNRVPLTCDMRYTA